MSHLVETMAYVGETPWHGLGMPVHNKMTVKEMQKAAGADFSIKKYPEFIEIGGKKVKTGQFALVRDDTNTILDSVSADWNETQPNVGFEFFKEFVENAAGKETDMHLHTAGVLDEGRMIFIMAKSNEGFSLFKGKDNIESNLLFSLPNQYGKSIIVMGTSIRVVCNNTLQLALSSGKSDLMVRINHRKTFDPEFVKATLNLNRKKVEIYKEAAEFLASKKANAHDSIEYFKELFPLTSNKKGKELSRNAKLISEIVETQPGAKFGAGTWWANFNAVTYATDHMLGNNDNTRLYSAFYGTGRNRKVSALKLATEYAKAA